MEAITDLRPLSRGRRRINHRRAMAGALWIAAAAAPIVLAVACGEPRASSSAASPVAPPSTSAPTLTPVLASGAASGAGEAPTRAVGNVALLMSGLIDPAADVVWGSVGTIVTAAGSTDYRPRTDKEWETVRNAALHLTEGGNLLMLGERAKDHDTWWRMSRALVDAGAVALQAAETKNVQALFDAGEGITIACDTCHAVYWP